MSMPPGSAMRSECEAIGRRVPASEGPGGERGAGRGSHLFLGSYTRGVLIDARNGEGTRAEFCLLRSRRRNAERKYLFRDREPARRLNCFSGGKVGESI